MGQPSGQYTGDGHWLTSLYRLCPLFLDASSIRWYDGRRVGSVHLGLVHCHRRQRESWPLPYALTVALFYLHPTNAVLLGFCIGLSAVIASVRAGRNWKSALLAWKGVLVMALGVLPKAISLLAALGSLASPLEFDERAWWALMALRKPHHVLMWTGSALLALTMLAALSSLLICALFRYVAATQTNKLVATLLPSLLFALIGCAVVGIWPTPRLAGLVLSRSLDTGVAMTVVASVALASWIITPRKPRGSGLITIAGFLLAPVLVLSAWTAPWCPSSCRYASRSSALHLCSYWPPRALRRDSHTELQRLIVLPSRWHSYVPRWAPPLVKRWLEQGLWRVIARRICGPRPRHGSGKTHQRIACR